MQLSETVAVGSSTPNKTYCDDSRERNEQRRSAERRPPCGSSRDEQHGDYQFNRRQCERARSGNPARKAEIRECLSRASNVRELADGGNQKYSGKQQPRAEEHPCLD